MDRLILARLMRNRQARPALEAAFGQAICQAQSGSDRVGRKSYNFGLKMRSKDLAHASAPYLESSRCRA
jgi:hypothetical protein